MSEVPACLHFPLSKQTVQLLITPHARQCWLVCLYHMRGDAERRSAYRCGVAILLDILTVVCYYGSMEVVKYGI